MGHAHLRADGVGFIRFLLHVGVPDLSITTHAVDLIWSTWDVNNTSHGDILLSEIFLSVSVSSLLDI